MNIEEQKKIAKKTLSLVMNQINAVRKTKEGKGKKKPQENNTGVRIGFLGAMKGLDIPTTPTGSLALDAAIGVGGYPQGRIVEMFGLESSGKTTLAIHAIVEAQKLGYACAFIDVEGTLDISYATALGIDADSLLFCQPNDGDEAMRIVDTLVRSAVVKLIVVDSVASLVPSAEFEGEITDCHIGMQARLMSQCLRQLTMKTVKTGTTIIFINQTRESIGLYKAPITTPGGNALKFYSTIRLKTARKEAIKNGDKVLGAITKVEVIKNKVAPPFKIAYFNLIYGKGIDQYTDIINTATDLNILDKAGVWYKYKDESIGQGLDNTIETLKAKPELLLEIKNAVTTRIIENRGNVTIESTEEEEVDSETGEITETE